jgi:hypothetical protein
MVHAALAGAAKPARTDSTNNIADTRFIVIFLQAAFACMCMFFCRLASPRGRKSPLTEL